MCRVFFMPLSVWHVWWVRGGGITGARDVMVWDSLLVQLSESMCVIGRWGRGLHNGACSCGGVGGSDV